MIMGVLNITPDSFYDGGRFFSKDAALAHAREMIAAGVDWIDIGGQSTRPGARRISADEEMDRVLPVIDEIAGRQNVTVSIDTFYASVAEEALKRGVAIVNDVTALGGDRRMAPVIARYNAGVILMHAQGTPQTMQDDPVYADVIDEIRRYLAAAVDRAVQAGIAPEKIMVDPGIGFGKTADHNLTILNKLDAFLEIGKPVVIGVSRKSFIGKVLNADTEGRLLGTAACCALAIARGARVIRVHDVAEMRDVAMMADAVIGSV